MAPKRLKNIYFTNVKKKQKTVTEYKIDLINFI